MKAWLIENKYRLHAAFFFVLAVVALLVPDAELLFCTFLICTAIWTAAHWLQKDFKAKNKLITQTVRISSTGE